MAASSSASTTTRLYSLAAELAKAFPSEPVGVYAGAGKSGIFRGGDFASVEREDIKEAVKRARDPPGRRDRRGL